MVAVRSRNEPGRLFLRRLGLFALVVLVLFGSWSVWGAWRKETESAELNQESQAALADLTLQQGKLQQNIATLESERGREAALRQQYAVGREGESLIVIVDPATTTPIAAPEQGIMDRIKHAFWWW